MTIGQSALHVPVFLKGILDLPAVSPFVGVTTLLTKYQTTSCANMAVMSARRERWAWLLLSIGIAAACGVDAAPRGPQVGEWPDASVEDGAPSPMGPDLRGGDSAVAPDAIVALTIDPAVTTRKIAPGTPVSVPLKVLATRGDGTRVTLTGGVVWSISQRNVGSVDSLGVFQAPGLAGGDVTVTATYGQHSAVARITLKLAIEQNPDSIDDSVRALLRAATKPEPYVLWQYPYDGTVFPRHLPAPLLMWHDGSPADAYLIRLTSRTFELDRFVRAPPDQRATLPQDVWDRFTESTVGAAHLSVMRFDGNEATVLVEQNWTIAPASTRGTIYYWANDRGRVLRIKPGALAPEDFTSANLGQLPASPCATTCHTVSADGSVLTSGGESLAGGYDLKADRVLWDEGGQPGDDSRYRWAYAGLSPTAKYAIESVAPSPIGNQRGAAGLFLLSTRAKVKDSGLDSILMGTPVFAPNGARIAFVDYQTGASLKSLKVVDFDDKTAKAANLRELVKTNGDGEVAFPSMSPDGKWVAYQRGTGFRTDSSNRGNLYLANVETGAEVRLAAANGDGYPFYAGDRDRNWNFEPTFAPVPAGGYFWVVFTSRRTHGNRLTGAAGQTKQLWVAAIDQNPQPGVDPSHPAFHLPGQGNDLNLRGFWALEACRGDGQACDNGSQCCGGYCEGAVPGASGTCRSAPPPCALAGDRCASNGDCCDAPAGFTCINRVCSEPTPPR